MKLVALFLIVVTTCEGYVFLLHNPRLLAKETTPQCQAPNGAGLEPILKEIQKYIPEDRVLMIILTALTSDKEVQDAMTYVTSQDGLARINRIVKSHEVSHVVRFACDELYLDVIKYINSAANVLGLPPLEPIRLRLPRALTMSPRTGVRGLIQDILDVVALDDIKTLIDEKMKTDKYVQLAVDKINSQEGRDMLERLVTNEDIQKLLEDLLKLGTDLLAVIQDFRCIFGWYIPNENESGSNSTLCH